MRTILENILEIISLQISDPTGTQTILQRAELLKRTAQRLAELDQEAALPDQEPPKADQKPQEPPKADQKPQEPPKADQKPQEPPKA